MIRQVAATTAEDLSFAFLATQHRLRNLRRNRPHGKVLVNGSPKSGTTWVVRLLATLPGYHRVGNYAGDLSRFRQVPPGAVIHGHEPYTPELVEALAANDIRVVLVIRDPRDQIVSRMFHIRRDGLHRWHARMNELPDDEALMHCIEGGPDLAPVVNRITLIQPWRRAESDRSVLCVRYELLKKNTVAEFGRVLDFLAIYINQALLQAVVHRNRFERFTVGRRIWRQPRRPGQANPASHFRKGIVGDWRNHFKEAHKERFKELAGDLLIDLGYERDLNW